MASEMQSKVVTKREEAAKKKKKEQNQYHTGGRVWLVACAITTGPVMSNFLKEHRYVEEDRQKHIYA